ncbi:MAG: hypothetical protein FJ267_13740 [Planctomycetes bacterium]|nr:hypothetical protein [Planctomycetota bacterium]
MVAISAWFKLRQQSRACQEAEFITKYPETCFLTGAAILPNAHRIEPRRKLPQINQSDLDESDVN